MSGRREDVGEREDTLRREVLAAIEALAAIETALAEFGATDRALEIARETLNTLVPTRGRCGHAFIWDDDGSQRRWTNCSLPRGHDGEHRNEDSLRDALATPAPSTEAEAPR